MRYLVELQSCRFRARNNRFAVFTAREIQPPGLGGWAYVVFRGGAPASLDHPVQLWGDWRVDPTHGHQLVVRTWLLLDSIRAGQPYDPSSFPAAEDTTAIEHPARRK